jgi:hypothetical protein
MYDLYNLGWHSFQELCLAITREIFSQTVESFLDSSDAGKDGAFAGTWVSKREFVPFAVLPGSDNRSVYAL